MERRVEVGTPEWLDAIRTGMLLSLHAQAYPDRSALVSEHGSRTFGELNARANQLARTLRARELTPGDRIAVLLPNRPELAETYYAVVRSGFRVVPINWHLTADEIAYILSDSAARLFVADQRFGEQARAAADSAELPAEARLWVGGEVPTFSSYEEIIGREPAHDLDDPMLGGAMLYTSGTTGRPKGVARPIGAANLDQAASAYFRLLGVAGYDPATDVHLLTGPLYHSAPLVLGMLLSLAAGVTCVLMDGWEPEATLQLVERYRVTHMHLVPTMFHRLLSLPESTRTRYDLSSLKFVLHGAAPCPVETKRAMIEWLGPIVHEYYAATEGLGTFIDSEEWLRKPGSVGRPDPGQVQILSDTGEPVPNGEPGTIYLQANEGARFEYFGDPDKTAKTYRGDSFTLGDVGYLDDDGYLYVIDRSADLIISGGVNIYPAEIDAALLQHPAVLDACTVGVPDAEWGEQVRAVVQLHPDVEPSDALADELIDFCRSRLAGYKCPRAVEFTEDLPRYETGKILRRAVRERLRARSATNA